MDYQYGKFNGTPFPSPDELFPRPKVVEFILQHGQSGLDALDNNDNEYARELLEQMIDAGLLDRDEATGELRMTPRMVRGIEHRALLEIFEGLQRGAREGHTTPDSGRSMERTEGTKTYEYGDPVSEIDLGATMRNALTNAMSVGKPGLPMHIGLNDFELHQTEGQTDVALCVLIDLSGSMMRYGRFFQAKRVALGLASLMRRSFPLDTVDFVGFYSVANPIREQDLALVMPKPVTIHDYEVRLRVPLDQAMAASADATGAQRVPQHFTNLQLGLRTARQILSRRGAANKEIFVITDGQPTAHVEPNEATTGSSGSGEMLYLLYPPTERTSTITLKEALRCQQQGIRIATFALIEDYWGMDWVGFVDQLTRLTRGVAYYCSSEDLSSTVIESYLSGKRQKSFIH